MNQSDSMRNRAKDTGSFKADNVIYVNPFEGYEGFEGWGTSLAWWGHVLGRWQNKEKANEVLDLVFDVDKGLGLNIVRYNIGGGENPSIQTNTLRPGGDVPGFQPVEGQWDWTADEGQRAVMLGAFERGVTIAEAFSNSPPYWMTISGSVTGASDGGNNLKEEHYNTFADYLTEVVRHYKDKYGIIFHTLNPLNEPISLWWKKGNTQEGCHFALDKQMDIIKKVAKSLKNKGLVETTVSCPDENCLSETIDTVSHFDKETITLISHINTHTYNGFSYKEKSNREADKQELNQLRELAAQKGKKLWMTEFGTGGTEAHNHEDMTSVMELADRIILDLQNLQPTAWVYWQAVEDEGAQNNWGFVHADFSQGDDYELTKQFYAMANFSKFIRPGSRIIPTDHEHSVAAYDLDKKCLTIVTRNEGDEKELSFDLSAFLFDSRTANIYLTSPFAKLAESKISIASDKCQVVLPEQSVTTIVIRNIEIR